MKVIDCEVSVICGDPFEQKTGIIVIEAGESSSPILSWADRKILTISVSPPTEVGVRRAYALILEEALKQKVASVALPVLGLSCLPSEVASAKIFVQELLKIIRANKRVPLRKILICSKEEGVARIFQKTSEGYIHHFVGELKGGPYVTVDAIIEVEGGLVLIERSNPPYGLALPGGFVDYGESLEEAVKREAKEETNLDLEGLCQLHTYSSPDRDPRFHTVSTVFIAKGRGQPKSGDDAKSLKIIPHGALLDLNYAFDHKNVIRDYLDFRKK